MTTAPSSNPIPFSVRDLANLPTRCPAIPYMTSTTITISFGERVSRILRQGNWAFTIDSDGNIIATLGQAETRVMSMFGSEEVDP